MSLSEEYQTDWLTERIENYLLHTSFQDTEAIIEGWLLADKYDLKRLKRKLRNIDLKRIEEMIKHRNFDHLQTAKKYFLVRKVLHKHLIDGDSILRFFDNFSNIDNHIWT